MPTQDRMAKAEVITFGSNNMSSNFSEPKDSISPETSPDPNTKKENSRKSKKDKVKKNKKNADNKSKDKAAPIGGGDLTKLDDLPSLGGPPGRKPAGGGFGRFGGFGVDDAEPVDDES